MSQDPVFETIARYGVVPVIAIESVDAAIPLADALLEGGLPVIEITFRTAAAAEVMQKISEQRPELLLGAGTVLTRENLDASKACGAKFAVAPGLNPAIVQAARQIGLPFVPGVAVPSDIESALSLGCIVLKYFPAEALGGVATIQAMAGPYAHTGVRFVPTGGVNAGNLQSYLAAGPVMAVGGTWIAKKEDVAAGNWQRITDRCKEVADIVARVRD